MGRRIGKGWKRFSRDAIYAQTVANNTSRLIRNVCQMKAQQRSRERRRKEQRRGSEISLANHRMVRVCLLARFPQSHETSRISEFRIMYDRDNGVSGFEKRSVPPLVSNLLLVDFESLETKRSFHLSYSFLIIRATGRE